MLSLIVTSLIVVLSPGTGVVYTVSTGLTKGRKASFAAAAGCTAGILPHLCLSVALLALLLRTDQRVFAGLKLVGALYLVYLGVGMILSRGKLSFDQPDSQERGAAIARRGFLLNSLNPQLTLFFLSFLPLYAGGNGRDSLWKAGLIGLMFMLLTLVVFLGYGALAGTLKRVVAKSPAGIRRVGQLSGIVFLAFAVNLAASALT